MRLHRWKDITEAIQHELERRRREELLRSLQSPHEETAKLAELGMTDWSARLPADDDGLVDPGAGRLVHWIEGQGWVEVEL